MNTRCYFCKFKLSDGIPPLEALSSQQHNALYGIRREGKEFPMPEMFEGLSPYSFCAFCITIIVDFPSALSSSIEGHKTIRGRNHFDKHPEHRVMFCECGELYNFQSIKTYDDSYPYDFDAFAIRRAVLHHAKLIYVNGDFTLADQLVDMDI